MPEKAKKARGKGRPFEKGDPRAGRPKGTPNKATAEIKALSLAFLEENYWPTLNQRWKDGRVLWDEVKTLMAYAHGKPKETSEITGADGGPIETVSRVEWVIVDGKRGKKASD